MTQNFNSSMSRTSENAQTEHSQSHSEIDLLVKESKDVLEEQRQEFVDTIALMEDSHLISLIDGVATVDAIHRYLMKFVSEFSLNQFSINPQEELRETSHISHFTVSWFLQSAAGTGSYEILPIITVFGIVKKNEKYLRKEIEKTVKLAKKDPRAFIAKIRTESIVSARRHNGGSIGHKNIYPEDTARDVNITCASGKQYPEEEMSLKSEQISPSVSSIAIDSQSTSKEIETPGVDLSDQSETCDKSGQNKLDNEKIAQDQQKTKRIKRKQSNQSLFQRFCAMLMRHLSACVTPNTDV